MSNELSPSQSVPTTHELPSGTGWTEGSAAPERGPEMSSPAPATFAPDDVDDPPRRKRRGFVARRVGRWTGRAFWLASIAGAIVILLLLVTVLGKWPSISNPFKTQTIDRSQPVLLVSIQDLAKFEAASGNFQVVVDIEQNQRFIPDIIFSQRSLFVAAGTVDAYVDFSNLGPNAVIASTDRKTVTLNLPAPQLDPANLDLSRSYVYASSSGIIQKFAGIFGGNTNQQQQLYLYAQQKIAAAAVDSQLGARAATNTKAMLTELLKSLGFTAITINFAAS
jgi:uncharacterized protein DUF4230